MFKLLVFPFFALSLTTAVSAQSHASYEITFGLFENQGGKLVLSKETSRIPFVTLSEGQVFGIVIKPTNNQEYSVKTISFLPSPPSSLSGMLEKQNPEAHKKGYESPSTPSAGETPIPFWLDEGDPTGVYRIDVYINEQFVREVFFEVFEIGV